MSRQKGAKGSSEEKENLVMYFGYEWGSELFEAIFVVSCQLCKCPDKLSYRSF